MRKPATNIRLGDGIEGLFDCVEQRVDRPRFGASQSRFDLLSLSRLNHWLPRGQSYPEVVQGALSQIFIGGDLWYGLSR
jgi:hypothetical protein